MKNEIYLKTAKRTASVVVFIIFSASLLCCRNLSSTSDVNSSAGTASVSADTGTNGLTVKIAYEDESDRSAFPDGIETAYSKLTYKAYLYLDSSNKGMLSTGAVSGSNCFFPFNVFPITATTAGTYTLEVFGFTDATVTDITKAFVFGTSSVSLSADAVTGSASVTFAPYAGGTKGSVNLALAINNSVADAVSASFSPELKATASTTAITASDVTPGKYTLTLTFKKSSCPVYVRTETVYVYPGIATTKWYASTSASDSLTVGTAEVYSTYYVCGTNGNYYKGGGTLSTAGISFAAASDSNTGGITAPLASVQAAVDKIEAGSPASGGTIYIDGTVTAARGSEAVKISSTTVPVTIKGLTGKDTDKILAQTDDEYTQKTCIRRVVSVGTGATLAMSGLTLSNGYDETGAGGITSLGTLTLTDCTVAENTGRYAGGIYISGTGTLNTGVSVSGNVQYSSDTGAGGIYVTAGTLYMTGSVTVTGNYSAGNVGGIYVADGANFYSGTSGSTAITGTDAILDNVSGNKVGGTTDSTYTGVCDVVRLGSTADDCYARISAPDVTKNQGGIAGACTALAAGGTVYLGKTTDTADVTWNVTGTVSIVNTDTLSVQPVKTAHKAIINGNKSASIFTCANTGALTLTNLGITGGSAENGGGINKSGNGTLTLRNTIVGTAVAAVSGTNLSGTQEDLSHAASSTTSYANYATYGGGIYLAGGEVDLTGSSAVAYNYAANGGGIYLNAGKLKVGTGTTDAGAEVYANGTSGSGGAIYNAGGSLDIYGCVHHNTAQVASGIYLVNTNGTTTMYAGSSIRDNKNTNTTSSCGSGVELTATGVSFTMEGGTISNNGSLNSTLIQYEVQVDAGTFTMSGIAVVKYTSNAWNSVYLASGTYITVGGTLTGTTPAAKLTVGGTITSGTTPAVALASGVTDPTIAKASGKFALTNTAYFIDNDGKIQSNAVADATVLTTLIGKVPAGEPVTLDLSGNVTVSSTIALSDGQDITLSASGGETVTNGESYKSLFTVPSGASLTLGKNVTLDVASASVSIASAVSVSGGSFTLDGGTLSCTTTNGNSPYLIYFTKGTLNIKSGTITGDNYAMGIRLECTSADDLVQIDGGTIENCCTGMYISGQCLNSDSHIENLTVTKNSYTNAGGGGGLTFRAGASGWTFTKCSITDNSTIISSGGASGGGICLYGENSSAVSTITFSGCTITGNYSQGNATSASSFSGVVGGGIYAWYATGIQFTGCTITGNYTNNLNGNINSYGGGIFVSQNSTMTVTGGTLSGNTTKVNGTATNGCGSQAYVYYDSSSTTHGSLTIGVTEHAATTAAYVID